jgi:hypothetical protein
MNPVLLSHSAAGVPGKTAAGWDTPPGYVYKNNKPTNFTFMNKAISQLALAPSLIIGLGVALLGIHLLAAHPSARSAIHEVRDRPCGITARVA